MKEGIEFYKDEFVFEFCCFEGYILFISLFDGVFCEFKNVIVREVVLNIRNFLIIISIFFNFDDENLLVVLFVVVVVIECIVVLGGRVVDNLEVVVDCVECIFREIIGDSVCV